MRSPYGVSQSAPVHTGHHHIRKHQLDLRIGGEDHQRRRGIDGLQNAVTDTAQGFNDIVANIGVVLYNENGLAGSLLRTLFDIGRREFRDVRKASGTRSFS